MISTAKQKIQSVFTFKKSKASFIQLAVFLMFSAAVFVCFPYLILEDPPEGYMPFYVRSTAIFSLLIAIRVLFFFLRVNISDKARRICSGILLLVYPLLCCIFVECINETYLSTGKLTADDLRDWAGNYLCYLLLFSLIYAIFRRAALTTLLGGGVTLVFGIATYFTTQFRGSPILPWDLQSFGTAMDVVNNYEFIVTVPMAVSVFLLLCMAGLASVLAPDYRKHSAKQRITERLVPAALCAALTVALLPLNLLSTMGISVWPWNQKESTKMTGVMAGFVGNIQFVMVEKPQGYSPTAVAGLGEEIKNLPEPEPLGSPEKKPTVIAIMNESLTDYMTIAENDTGIAQDYLPFIHSLMEEPGTISGTAYSSVFGGNTCDSEYEFLTGNSMHFLPGGSVPYQQYVKTEQTSLVSTLKSQDYTCLAIHPGSETAWSRNTAYEHLGFDHFTYAYIFYNKREMERSLTSDPANYRQVILEYENHKANSTNPLFIFNVTIQNHGGYKIEDYPSTVEISSGNYPQTEQYLTLAKKSDEAFQDLIAYFKEQEEPVVLLMFGDHWPSIADENDYYEDIMGIEDLDNAAGEDLMKKYQVPYLVWANYPLSETDEGDMSLNYLKNLLLRSAGLECTPFDKYLDNLRQTLPVITSKGIIDSSGGAYTLGDDGPYSDLLNEYYMLQYNQTMDRTGKDQSLFTINTQE